MKLLLATAAVAIGSASYAAMRQPSRKLYATAWFGGVVSVVDVATRRMTANVRRTGHVAASVRALSEIVFATCWLPDPIFCTVPPSVTRDVSEFLSEVTGSLDQSGPVGDFRVSFVPFVDGRNARLCRLPRANNQALRYGQNSTTRYRSSPKLRKIKGTIRVGAGVKKVCLGPTPRRSS